MRDIRWRRARPFGACALVALALVSTVLATDAWPDSQQIVPTADDRTSSVPAIASHVSCPEGRRGFQNPLARYTLCYPSGWGFTDFTTMGPLDAIPARMLRNLHLVSEAAFPWVTGTRSFDAIRGGVIDVEINLLAPGVGAEDECEPLPIADAGLLACEQHYDVLGLPASDGPVRALKVELRSPSPDGARLLVIVRTASTRKEVDVAWQLVRSIRLV